jgi:drug/metabolite transporter (DMT)-like permease
MSIGGLLLVLSSVGLVIAGQLVLRWAMTLVGAVDATRLAKPVRLLGDVMGRWQTWLGLALYGLSGALWIVALSRVPLSVAYPFLGLGYVGVVGLASWILKERVTPAQWLAVLVIVAGVLVVVWSAGA